MVGALRRSQALALETDEIVGSLKRIRARLAKKGVFPSTFGAGGEPAVRLSDSQARGREEVGSGMDVSPVL